MWTGSGKSFWSDASRNIMKKEEQLILAQAEDKIEQSRTRGYITWTPFLDSHQQSVLRKALAREDTGVSLEFYGGYDDAERVILACAPPYLQLEEAEPLTVLRVSRVKSGGKPLTHRDYLGSLIGLGIRREMTGDILVREDGADIIVLRDIAEFILNNYNKAGKTELSVEQKSIGELIVPPVRSVTVHTTVASLRLDNILSSGFGISRTKAGAAVRAGLVSVNHTEAEKPDMNVGEGDLVTMRKSGRIRVTQVGGRSRKDRVYVTLEKYGR